MADWSKYQVSTQVAPDAQKAADVESLAILKSERKKPFTQEERAALEREIQRVSQKAGVAYDLGIPAPQTAQPEAARPTPVSALDRSVVPQTPGSASWDQPINLKFGGGNPANATGRYMPRPVDVMHPNSLGETNASFQKRVVEAQRAYDAQSRAVGGGRGGQGGPTAEQAADQTFTPVAQMAPTAAERENRVNPTLKGLTYGAAKGATAGTFDYLPAGMAYAYSRVRDKLGAGRPDNYTFKELLAAQRGQSQDIAAAAPIAYTLGDVGGSVGLGMATGGASLPATMASQGVQGAVRKYSESEDTNLEDAAKAGAISAGVAGVLKGAGDAVVKGATKLKDSVLAKAMESRNVNIARENAKIAAANTQAVAKQAEQQAAADAAYLKNLPDSGPIPPKPVVPAAAIVAEKPLLTEATYAAQQGAQPIAQLAGKRIRQVAKNAAVTLTPSALAGSGAYYLASENPQWGIDPTMAGMVAGGAPLARKSIRDMVPQSIGQAKAVAGLAINKYPNVLPNATRAGVAAGGALAGQAQGLPVGQEVEDPVVSKWGKYAE